MLHDKNKQKIDLRDIAWIIRKANAIKSNAFPYFSIQKLAYAMLK